MSIDRFDPRGSRMWRVDLWLEMQGTSRDKEADDYPCTQTVGVV